MPPKPRPTPVRKPSISSRDAPPKVQTSMPPPPDPPQPQGILVPEVMALSTCLRNAVVKTGQIYGHYADTRKLAIHKHAPYPPRTLTASLGREVEKYDQLCDAMESHLLHAINVLQRDLVRAQEKLNAAAAVPMAVTPPPIQTSLPAVYSPTQSEDQSVQSESKVPSSARRPSTISLSSLQRPPFPHKLDLSSTILRLNPEDPLTSLQSGLASPVTLAPKSSISKYPPDLLGGSQHVDIDLTLDDDDMSMATGSMGAGTVGGAALGSSADKPIELDLDMDDIFGDAPQQAQVVSGASTSNISSNVIPKQEDTAMDLSLLSSVPTMGSTDISHGLMSFNPSELPPNAPGLSVPQAGQPSAPSPNSLLSGLQQPGPHNGEPQFDFDLNFLEQSDSMGMRMDDIFDMSNIGQPHSGGNSTTGN